MEGGREGPVELSQGEVFSISTAALTGALGGRSGGGPAIAVRGGGGGGGSCCGRQRAESHGQPCVPYRSGAGLACSVADCKTVRGTRCFVSRRRGRSVAAFNSWRQCGGGGRRRPFGHDLPYSLCLPCHRSGPCMSLNHCSRTEGLQSRLAPGRLSSLLPVMAACSLACSREALQQLLATKQDIGKLAQIEALLAGKLGSLSLVERFQGAAALQL